MHAEPKKIVLCAGARTPIGHIARALSALKPEDLLERALAAVLERTGLAKDAVDGVIAGAVGQPFTAPNIARVAALRAGLPERVQSVTVQNNCVSSIEAVSAAARFILAGEGELYLAGGTESMSRLPYTIDGSRSAKPLRSLSVLREKWNELPGDRDVAVVDSIERGLTDPVAGINMAGCAEVSAQMHGVTRAAQDEYARESFRRAVAGWNEGFYAGHVAPVRDGGAAVLEKDEYPFLREDLVDKPRLLAKAAALYDNAAYPLKDFYRDFGRHMGGKAYREGDAGTVTLFNSCGRSDGAAAVIVSTERRARELGLEILAELKGWGYCGNNPAHMGVAPALAAPVALGRAGAAFKDLDLIELHEPFAATVLAIFKVGREKFGHDWEEKNAAGALNPHGGSIALGHPLGATGVRLLLNLLYGLKGRPNARLGMIAACAGGGMGGALVV
ncbi:MAG TPA: thiolase family protein, partial [Elusimicrobiota bacterium]|nr:thiolase family protein [Elusimicrobiota bacterium]